MVSKEYFGENKEVEFKQEIPSKHEKFLKDIIAFANTSGGKSIIGIVDETKEVVGIGDQSPSFLRISAGIAFLLMRKSIVLAAMKALVMYQIPL